MARDVEDLGGLAANHQGVDGVALQVSKGVSSARVDGSSQLQVASCSHVLAA
jgi:hypothetical protein